jgi:ATP-binding cassette subfamily B multidrug efflux pump
MSQLKRFWLNYAHRYRWVYLVGVLCLLATNALTVSIPRFVEFAIDNLQNEGGSRVTFWVGIILIAGLGVIVVRTLSRTLFFNPGRTVEFRVKNAMFNQLLRLPQAFYDKMPPGDIISRGTNDSNSVRALIGYGSLMLFNVVFALILTLIQMLTTKASLTLICILPLFVAAAILRMAIRAMFKVVRDIQKQVATLSDRILESYNGAGTIRAFNAQSAALERFSDANEALLELSIKLARIMAWLLPIVHSVGNLCLVLLLYFGGKQVINGEISIGQLAAFAVYINILVASLTSLGWLVNSIQRGWVSLGRINEILEAPTGRSETSEVLPLPKESGLPVAVTGLSFTYPSADTPVLDDISFTAQAGETVGFFGLTGSGKSTLLNILARLYDPPAGTVTAGGVDITKVDVKQYWQKVAYVPQDPFLFSQSIAENIAIADLAGVENREAIGSAAHDGALAEDLDALPDGLDTRVGERGVTLSGGQKQRSALARAFYREYDVLLLDDVLSAVDHATEQTLIEAIYRRGRGATMLVVSHRISVLSRADKVIVLDHGKIVDQGTHQELVDCKTGLYYRAWRLQQEEDNGDHHE